MSTGSCLNLRTWGFSKYGEFNNHDYDTILRKWPDADDANQKHEKLVVYLKKS